MASDTTSAASEKKATVLLIHGTFAGNDADEGPAWWQRGSETWERLEALLPDSAQLDEVFHWGVGPNSQRSRREAGLKLLERLRAFERDGRPYHLVGHSHGGSVIWAALQLAVIEKGHWDELRGLRSWTTIGTPFLHFDAAPTPISSMPGMRWYSNAYKGIERLMAKVLPRRLLDSFFAASAVAIPLVVLLTVVIVGVSLLLFEADGEAALIGTIAMLAVMLPLALLYMTLLEQYVERFQFHREHEAGAHAFRSFGSRWLGLHSKDDEAINSLKASLELNLRIVPRRSLPKRVFHSDEVMKWSRPFRRLVNPLFNWWVAPAGDRFILSQLARSAQGNDRPGTHVVAVSSSPVPSDTACPPLPEDVSQRLTTTADANAARVVPALREMLGQIATSGLQLSQGNPVDTVGGDALIHTGYFADDEVVGMIAWHLARASGEETQVALRPELVTWLQGAKRAVGAAPAIPGATA